MTAITDESQKTFITTRNYTSEVEKDQWWYMKRWSKDWQCCNYGNRNPFYLNKERFRTRRTYVWENRQGGYNKAAKKALRVRVGNSDEIGAFARLTSNYLLVGCDENFGNFSRTARGDLPDIPIICTSLAGCRVTGRMCVGNKHGLLVPEGVYDTEMRNITDGLPDSVEVRKIEDRLSALGNVITCNDSVALIHPDLDKESEEIVADTLQVDVFRHTLGTNALVGSYCVLNNAGGLVCNDVSNDFIQNLSSLLQLPLTAGTVNNGNKVLASGMIVNDFIAYAGMKTTTSEFKNIEDAFQLDQGHCGLWN